MGEIKRYNEIIIDEMKTKGININDLIEKTNITSEYIKAIINRNLSILPSLPYVRGYFREISNVLGIDFDLLWNEFISEGEIKKSGRYDKLPLNRFEIKHSSKRTVVIAVLISAVLLFIIYYMVNFMENPKINVIDPANKKISVQTDMYKIKGIVSGSGIKVTINGDEVVVDNDGTFEKSVYLDKGINVFKISAKKLLGRKYTVTRIVVNNKTDNILENKFNKLNKIISTSSLTQ